MQPLNRLFRAIIRVNWIKTVYYNYRLFSAKVAIKMPLLVDNSVIIRRLHRGGVIIDSKVISFGMIRLGHQDLPTQDRAKTRMIVFVGEDCQMVFKGSARIGGGTKILLNNHSELVFGNNFYLSLESSIYCFERIEFGESCTVGWNVLIMDTDWHRTFNKESGEQYTMTTPVRIGNHCWICNDVQIQKGTDIPNNTIVAAKSLCNKKYSVPEYSLLAGVPATLKKGDIDYVR